MGLSRADVVIAGHAGDTATARSALSDEQPDVRAAALGALARCGALTAAELVLALDDPASMVRRRAAEEAARIESPEPALAQALVAHLGDGDLGVVEAATFAVGELAVAPPEAVTAVAAIVTGHPEVVLRETAVAALGSMGAPAGLAAVLAATSDVATVRRRAVLALAAFDGDDVEATLARLATDRDRQVRQAAEDLLHGWGGEAATADP